MTAPSFISVTTTTLTSGPGLNVTTGNIAVQNGDVIVASAVNSTGSEAGNSNSTTIATNTGSTSTWTSQFEVGAANANSAYIQTWTATATATGNITVEFTIPSGGTHTGHWGGIVKVWRGSNGIGTGNASNNNGTGSGTPTVSATTSGADSGIDFTSVDWNEATGTITFTATSGTPVQDVGVQDTGQYSVYSDHVLDSSTTGSKTMAMSSPTGQRYVCTMIEVLGTSGSVTGMIYPQFEDITPGSRVVQYFGY